MKTKEHGLGRTARLGAVVASALLMAACKPDPGQSEQNALEQTSALVSGVRHVFARSEGPLVPLRINQPIPQIDLKPNLPPALVNALEPAEPVAPDVSMLPPMFDSGNAEPTYHLNASLINNAREQSIAGAEVRAELQP